MQVCLQNKERLLGQVIQEREQVHEEGGWRKKGFLDNCGAAESDKKTSQEGT